MTKHAACWTLCAEGTFATRRSHPTSLSNISFSETLSTFHRTQGSSKNLQSENIKHLVLRQNLEKQTIRKECKEMDHQYVAITWISPHQQGVWKRRAWKKLSGGSLLKYHTLYPRGASNGNIRLEAMIFVTLVY